MPILPLVALLAAAGGPAPRPAPHATIRERRDTLVTYPFSDPDPIPVMGRIYPYFRFDGFTDTPVRKAWTVVELENAYLRVRILPEIGGKIWSAVEKRTGREFLYDNHVVKFRDIALRGPWTSGGIEANYGIIGHTPNVATPVDYQTRRNADGSVTCVVAALDLLTRTRWQLEITLPADKAYFTTSSTWHNPTPYEQPYYSWMNAAISARDDLEYVYDGTRYIGHDGERGDWPVNRTNGKVVSWYRNNDFGGYKSYHVFGAYTDFFGAYWHDLDFGMARYAPRDEKPGKKLWIWGLSRQGMIWESLLTDHDGQYSEVQSGRLFNQTSDASSRTPFTHRGFAPYGTDRWTEYWMPVVKTGGFVLANAWGALNIRSIPGAMIIALSPVQRVADTLTVSDGARILLRRLLRLEPLEPFADTIPAVAEPGRIRVMLGDHKLEYQADVAERALSRPVVRAPGVDSTTAARRAASGNERARERDYDGAALEYAAALAVDSNYVPALDGAAAIALRRGAPGQALPSVRRALSIDTYDPEANYLFGLASRSVGALPDARDGFEIATQSVEYRSAAYTELARTYLRAGDPGRAITYASHALDFNRFDLDALQLRALAERLRGDATAAGADQRRILALEPLNHFVAAERWLAHPTAGARLDAVSTVRNEMPAETFLELALWYVGAARLDDADRVLALAPPVAMVLYWRAYLHHQLGEADTTARVADAERATPRFVFPFRPESAEMLRWAAAASSNWKAGYYLALCEWANGDSAAAHRGLVALADRPDLPSFYAARASFAGTDAAAARADLERAAVLDPGEWRFGRLLAERALADQDTVAAVRVAADYHGRFPANSALSVLLARSLLRDNRADDARKLLDRVVVLPYEGAGEAHALYREANLRVAFARLMAHDAAGALALTEVARQWPERLGAGKPYPPMLDERLEDGLTVIADAQLGRRVDAAVTLARLLR